METHYFGTLATCQAFPRAWPEWRRCAGQHVLHHLLRQLSWHRLVVRHHGGPVVDDQRHPGRAATNPGDHLRTLLECCAPCLVLVGEWVAYARHLVGVDDLPAGWLPVPIRPTPSGRSPSTPCASRAKSASRCCGPEARQRRPLQWRLRPRLVAPGARRAACRACYCEWQCWRQALTCPNHPRRQLGPLSSFLV